MTAILFVLGLLVAVSALVTPTSYQKQIEDQEQEAFLAQRNR